MKRSRDETISENHAVQVAPLTAILLVFLGIPLAVVVTVMVMLMVAAILRLVDVRKELAG